MLQQRPGFTREERVKKWKSRQQSAQFSGSTWQIDHENLWPNWIHPISLSFFRIKTFIASAVYEQEWLCVIFLDLLNMCLLLLWSFYQVYFDTVRQQRVLAWYFTVTDISFVRSAMTKWTDLDVDKDMYLDPIRNQCTGIDNSTTALAKWHVLRNGNSQNLILPPRWALVNRLLRITICPIARKIVIHSIKRLGLTLKKNKTWRWSF